jgi:predicted methyltransferase
MRNLSLLIFLAACAGAPPETSVPPADINKTFKSATLDVDAMAKRFETESREVFARRSAIARAVGLRPGMTGLFVDFFARDVELSGRVYAVEIAPRFIERLQERARSRGLSQVKTVLCTTRDVSLPESSVDVVFTCATYHHFEHPRATLASIHKALRPGGKLVIVDFERIPGVTREWVLGHVRCGKSTVIEEVTAVGFKFGEAVDVGLRENYFVSFTKI